MSATVDLQCIVRRARRPPRRSRWGRAPPLRSKQSRRWPGQSAPPDPGWMQCQCHLLSRAALAVGETVIFADTPSLSTLNHLSKRERGAAESQSRRWLGSADPAITSVRRVAAVSAQVTWPTAKMSKHGVPSICTERTYIIIMLSQSAGCLSPLLHYHTRLLCLCCSPVSSSLLKLLVPVQAPIGQN